MFQPAQAGGVRHEIAQGVFLVHGLQVGEVPFDALPVAARVAESHLLLHDVVARPRGVAVGGQHGGILCRDGGEGQARQEEGDGRLFHDRGGVGYNASNVGKRI